MTETRQKREPKQKEEALDIQVVEQVVRATLAAELQPLRTQLEAMGNELRTIRTASDLLLQASQVQAPANEAQINRAVTQALVHQATIRRAVTQDRQPEEAPALINEREGTEGCYDAALPLPRDIKLPGREEGPAPIVLVAQRQVVTQ